MRRPGNLTATGGQSCPGSPLSEQGAPVGRNCDPNSPILGGKVNGSSIRRALGARRGSHYVHFHANAQDGRCGVRRQRGRRVCGDPRRACALDPSAARNGGRRPLRANAGDPTATWVAQDLPAALAQAQSDRGGAGAPISARVDYVTLGPSSGGVCGPSPDQIIGAVTVGGVTRPLRASTSYSPSPVDQAMIEQSNRNRVLRLVQAFAFWAVREV